MGTALEHRGQRHPSDNIGLAVATTLLGDAGTAMGIYFGGLAIGDSPDVSIGLLSKVLGSSQSPEFLDAFIAGLDAIILAVAGYRLGNDGPVHPKV